MKNTRALRGTVNVAIQLRLSKEMLANIAEALRSEESRTGFIRRAILCELGHRSQSHQAAAE